MLMRQPCASTSNQIQHLSILELLIKQASVTATLECSARLQKHLSEGMGLREAIDYKLGDFLINAAQCYMNYFIFMVFLEQINTTKDQNIKALLTLLCQLYAVNTILANPGKLIEAKLINEEQITLLKEAREEFLP